MPCFMNTEPDEYDVRDVMNAENAGVATGVARMTPLLCSACRALERYGYDFGENPALDVWWTSHKTEDARKAAEAKAAEDRKAYRAAKAPHCMLCGARNEGQVVSAHSNQQRDGKGASLKASDAAIAFLCWTCHGRVDQGNEPKAVKLELWEQGHRTTMRWLVESGHFIVSPVPTPPPVIPVGPKAKIPKRKSAWPSRRLESGKREWPSRSFQTAPKARDRAERVGSGQLRDEKPLSKKSSHADREK